MAVPFETLSAEKDLQKAGMDVVQTEAVTMAVKSSNVEFATQSNSTSWSPTPIGLIGG